MRTVCLLVLVIAGFSAGVFADPPPLHEQIDEHLQIPASVKSRCSDAEFLRRVSLDLTGIPPGGDEARSFLSDPAPDKRERLIDRLLDSPHFARHLSTLLDLMLMERRAAAHVSLDDWRAWLLKSVRENKPWNVLAREILSADGDEAELRPAVRFFLDRAAEPNLLTRDISRIFFGRDIQCAQCHNHPLVDDYRQSDYQGLLACVAPSYAVAIQKGDAKVTVLGERAGTDLQFESVFFKGTQHRTGPRLPGGLTLDEPLPLPSEEYTVPVADGVKAVPKFSRRQLLAELSTNGTNRAFNENIANRAWSWMFGQGLVEPPDMLHSDNPPTHPALLRLLGEHLSRTAFDLRAFLRELALTTAYQQSFDLPQGWTAVAGESDVAAQQCEVEQKVWHERATSARREYDAALETWQASEAALLPVIAERDKARAAYAEARKKHDDAAAALAAAQARLPVAQETAQALKNASDAAALAASKLPGDQELAGAAAKLTERSTKLATEVAAVQKMIDETTPQMPELAATLAAARKKLDEETTRVQPLREAWKQNEVLMLEARRQTQICSTQRNAQLQQLSAARRLAELTVLQNQVAEAQAKSASREVARTMAQEAVASLEPELRQRESVVRSAEAKLTAATAARETAQKELEKQSEVQTALTSALQLVEGARNKLGDEGPLKEMVTQLRERAAALETELGAPRQRVEQLIAAETAAREELAVAERVLAEGTAERDKQQEAARLASEAAASAESEAVAAQTRLEEALSAGAPLLADRFALASLKPLGPEQLCWSIFKVTGIYDQHRAAEEAELDKSSPLTEEQKQDPAQLRERAFLLEQRTFDKLKGHRETFARYYGAAAGQPQRDFFATVDQALYASNGGELNSWVAAREGNVTARMVKAENSDLAAEELYLQVFSRLPSDDERQEVAQRLAGATDREMVVRELVWGAVTSTEFRFNH